MVEALQDPSASRPLPCFTMVKRPLPRSWTRFVLLRRKFSEKLTCMQCPGCPWGGLDLSPGLFAFFAPLGTGIIYGTWYFGSAPAPAPTTTWQAPAPTTTWKPSPTSTWSPPPTTSTTTTWSSSSSSSSSVSSSSSSAAASSSSAKHSGTSSSAPAASPAAAQGPDALDSLNQVFVQLAVIIFNGASAN